MFRFVDDVMEYYFNSEGSKQGMILHIYIYIYCSYLRNIKE